MKKDGKLKRIADKSLQKLTDEKRLEELLGEQKRVPDHKPARGTRGFRMSMIALVSAILVVSLVSCTVHLLKPNKYQLIAEMQEVSSEEEMLQAIYPIVLKNDDREMRYWYILDEDDITKRVGIHVECLEEGDPDNADMPYGFSFSVFWSNDASDFEWHPMLEKEKYMFDGHEFVYRYDDEFKKRYGSLLFEAAKAKVGDRYIIIYTPATQKWSVPESVNVWDYLGTEIDIAE